MAPPRKNVPRPGRALLTLLAIVIGLAGLMFLQGQKTPKLALDLAGGTSVTLTAHSTTGKAPTSENMTQAIEIIRQRVNGLGVSEAEVTKQGNDVILVEVPRGENKKDDQRMVDLVGTTAKLEFRQVIVQAAATPQQPQPTPTPTPTKGKSGKKPKSTTSPTAKNASPSPTSKGRAVSDALAKPTPTPPPVDQTTPVDPTAPDLSKLDPALRKQFETIDCNNPGTSLSLNQPADKEVVACQPANKKNKEPASKFILGPVKVAGTEVTKATAQPPNAQQGGSTQWSVTLRFNSSGSKKFADFTSKVAPLGEDNPQNHFAIVLDKKVVSAPSVKSAITGGNAEITGDFSQREASDLANVLKYGALPLEFKRSAVEEVSPTLGKDQLTGGLIAGAIGMGLVVLYSMFYYRALGLVSIASLGVAALLTYETVVMLGNNINYRLSLAGIAGLIVAIGITADSFIVYFERLRDEVREGRSIRSAAERGWERARRTILIADAVSFIAALMLYIFAIGNVRGFAFTLGLTTLLDVVVVFLFTKPLVTWLVSRKFFYRGHAWSGLDARRLGIQKRVVSARPSAKEA